jgi:hypothetical protein
MLYRDSEKPKRAIVKVGDKWGLKDFYEGRSLPHRQKRGARAPCENGASPDDEAPE